MRAIYIMQRVIGELVRDKRTLAMMFVAPVFIMFLLKLIFTASATTTVNVATVGLPDNVRTSLAAVKHVTVSAQKTRQAAEKRLQDQKVDAIVAQKADNHYDLTFANTDSTKTALVKQAFQAALTADSVSTLKQTTIKLSKQVASLAAMLAKLNPAAAGQKAAPAAAEATKAAKPTITNHYRYGNADTGFFDKILPILMGFFVFFFVFLISGMALLKERTSGTLDRLLATPVRRGEIVCGYMLSYGILAVIQTVIIVLCTVYFMNIQIVGALLAVMAISFLLALVALAFGILMSTFAQSEFQMMQFIPIIVIPQVFFSGIVPLDSLADWVQNISYALPLTYAGDAMTQVMMYGTGLRDLGLDIGMLLVFLVGLTALNICGMRRYRKV